MNSRRFVVDVAENSFEKDVIEASNNQLVLVDFWAAWCGPCRSLTPVLERLAEQYEGSFVLAKVDTDAEQTLAAKFGIRSLPTVMFFLNGEVVDQFMGVQPESAIRALIDKHVVRESDALLAQALDRQAVEGLENTVSTLKQIVADDPANDRPRLKLAELLIDQGQYEEAKNTLDALPAAAKSDQAYLALSARLALALETLSSPETDNLRRAVESDPNDLEARFQFAHRLAAESSLDEALDQLIEIIKRDRKFKKDAPRQTMLKIFQLAGNEAPLVAKYRRLLAQTLN